MHVLRRAWVCRSLLLLLLLVILASGQRRQLFAHGETPATEPTSPDQTSAATVLPLDKSCLDGLLLGGDGAAPPAGLTITATPYGADGQLDTGAAVNTISDSQGRFHLEAGLFPARWQIELPAVDGWEMVTPTAVPVELAFGRTTCAALRFHLRQSIPVTVQKLDATGAPGVGWRIRAQPAADNRFAVSQEAVTDANGMAQLHLSSGQWLWSEGDPTGAPYQPVWLNRQQLRSYIAAPGPFTLRLDPTAHPGCIEVYQHQMDATGATTPNHLSGWRIELQRADGVAVQSQLTDANGVARFANLLPGAYRVAQASRTGWIAVAPGSYAVMVAGGACAQVNFYNEAAAPAYCISGQQVEQGSQAGVPGVKITARPLWRGGYQPDPVYTDGMGAYRFTFPAEGKGSAGSLYQICTDSQSGWPVQGATCTVVTLPRQPGACVTGPRFTVLSASGSDGCRLTHLVVRGESLSGVAAAYGVPFQSVLNANRWVLNRYQLYLNVGDRLCIP